MTVFDSIWLTLYYFSFHFHESKKLILGLVSPRFPQTLCQDVQKIYLYDLKFSNIIFTKFCTYINSTAASGWCHVYDYQTHDFMIIRNAYTVKCHYNACHYNANASLTRSILGSQTAPTCPHNHPQVAQHMGKRCEIIAVWSATATMKPLCSHTNDIKQRYPTCWLCQYSRFMIDLRSNTQIIHLRCSENAIIWPIRLLDARMLKTIPVAIKLR